MLFNSYTFWLFYLVVFLIYWKLGHTAQNRLLLVASYVFYGAWDWKFLSLILLSTSVDYLLGQRIYDAPQPRKKVLLFLSIAVNLTILGIFKYYGFFSNELNGLFVELGISAMLPTLDIILPVGISFYTFQTMSYSIDIYRGKVRPIRSFPDYALYVAFFPQLVAGPIERSSRLLPQVIRIRSRQNADFLDGFYLVLYGLFLKIVIADNMAPLVDNIFAKEGSQLTGPEVLIGLYAFAFQIYGDFAGYSSIARGVAKWLGFDLMVNFRMPYLATNPPDFWRRWHISLSSWFRDYVYIPLGGNRAGELSAHRNAMMTMILSGMWHGAAWTFVIWGILHGLYLSLYKLLGGLFGLPTASRFRSLQRLVAMCVMFHLVLLGWLFFRAENINQAIEFMGVLSSSFEVTELALGFASIIAFYVFPLILYEFWVERNGLMALTGKPARVQAAFYLYILTMLLFFPSPQAHEFIYFQF